MPKVRSSFWDLVKFIAIALVVFGHVQGAAGMTVGHPFVGNFIVNMNMPLFCLISGYFSYGLVSSGDWKKFGWRVVGYFWPLMITAVLFQVLECVFGMADYKGPFPVEVMKWFLFGGWYLYVLAISVVIVFACSRLRGIAVEIGRIGR